jgi:hypothetical protein
MDITVITAITASIAAGTRTDLEVRGASDSPPRRAGQLHDWLYSLQRGDLVEGDLGEGGLAE